MAKREDTQELKAQHKIQIREWVLHGEPINTGEPRPDFLAVKTPDGITYYREIANRQVEILKRENLISEIAVASANLAEASGKAKLGMTQEHAKDCLFLIEGYIKSGQCDKLLDDDINPVGFVDDEGYCFTRIPLVRAYLEPTEKRIKSQRQWDGLGPFMISLLTNMADYDGSDSRMFRRLLSAVGALLWDSEPRREILYWHGMGGEGKTTFCNFLVQKLGPCALPNIKPKKLTEDYTIAQLEGMRLVVAEEAGKGRFLTEEIKALTGNRYLTGRAPYQAIRTFRNHTFFWMTSNQMPIIDGEDSSKDRLRLICSTPRKDGSRRSEREIFEELELHWPHIVDAAVLEYFAAGKSVLPMLDEENEGLINNYFAYTDGWILKNLEYKPGAFVPITTLTELLVNKKTNTDSVAARLVKVLEPVIKDSKQGPIIKTKARTGNSKSNPVWGFKNVGLTSAAHFDVHGLNWREYGPLEESEDCVD